MAENEIKRVITIESSESLNTLNNLNARIKELKGTMGDLDITTEEYRQVSEEVTQLENVKRNAIRGVTAAVEGSYNAYSKELSILQKHRKTLNENTQEYKDMTKRVAELQQKLKDMDADVGVYSRNVGNYSSAFDGLQGAVDNAAKKLPQLSSGFAGFAAAMVEDIPKIIAQLQAMTAAEEGAAVANETMAVTGELAGMANNTVATSATAAAAGETAMGVAAEGAAVGVSTLIKACTSWNVILLAIITLFQIFADDIQEWIKGLFEVEEQIDHATEVMREFSKEIEATGLGIGDEIVKIKELQSAWLALVDNLDAKKKFIEENKSVFDGLGVSIQNIADADRLFIDQTDDYIEAIKLRAQADAAKRLADKEYDKAMAASAERAQKERELANTERYSYTEATTWVDISTGREFTSGGGRTERPEYINLAKEVDALKEQEDAAMSLADSYFELAKAKELASNTTFDKAGFTEPTTTDPTSSTYKKPAFKDSRSTRPERMATTADWGYEDAVDAAAEQEALKATLEARTKMLTANAEERKTIEEQLQQELATIEELRLVNHEIILNELLRDEELTAEERMALEEALTQNKIDQAQLQIEAEEERAKKEKVIRDKEAKEDAEREKQMQRVKAEMLNTTTALIRQSAELFEEDSKERKALNAAAIVMDTYKAAMAAWTAAQGLPPGIGQAVGAANVAASVAMGVMQLANLFKVAPDGSNAEGALSSAQGAPNVASSMPASYTRSLQGDNELTEMNKDTRVYVVESDITNAQKSARVRVESASF